MDYNKLLQEVITEARKANIPVSNNINPIISINTRAKCRLGLCKRNGDSFDIEISAFLEQAGENAIKQILAHEILHTCPNCMNHGRTWKYYAMKMNMDYGYDIERTDSCANLGIVSPKERNYVIQCQKCGREEIRERASKVTKNIDKYRCKCGGKLILL